MPKKGKNKWKFCGQQGSISHGANDVKLNDFANSSHPRSGQIAIRKFNSIPVILQEASKKSWEELDWFDRDLEDYENVEPELMDKSEDEQETQQKRGATVRKRRQTKRSEVDVGSTDHGEGNLYPADIWFILSDYIRPEDVGKFASICKATYEVTCTSRFWIRLYNRYHKYVPDLPVRLQPHNIRLKLDGLKVSVVRALYYLYGPYVEKYQLNQQQEPHTLIMKKCVITWHERGKFLHKYFFKMEDQQMGNTKEPLSRGFKKTEETHYRHMLGNIHANSEKRFQILQITSSSFIFIPPNIMDQTLVFATCLLSPDLRSHIVRLIFGPPHAQLYYRKGKQLGSVIPDGCTEIILTHVMCTKVLNWWSPNYPFISTVVATERNETRHSAEQQQEDIYF